MSLVFLGIYENQISTRRHLVYFILDSINETVIRLFWAWGVGNQRSNMNEISLLPNDIIIK